MSIRKSLFTIIILSIFIPGCSSSELYIDNQFANEAKYQQTMTKVQNDVNEIMDKDYEYVVNNMGDPYCTTYYLNLNRMDITNTLNEENKTVQVMLTYPKYSDEKQIEESAIYVSIKNDKVVSVETYELSDLIYTIEEQNQSDVVFNKYSKNTSTFFNINIDSGIENYIGKDVDRIKNLVGTEIPDYEIYNYRDGVYRQLYFIDDINKEENEILSICINENEIKDIQIVNVNDLEIEKYIISE